MSPERESRVASSIQAVRSSPEGTPTDLVSGMGEELAAEGLLKVRSLAPGVSGHTAHGAHEVAAGQAIREQRMSHDDRGNPPVHAKTAEEQHGVELEEALSELRDQPH